MSEESGVAEREILSVILVRRGVVDVRGGEGSCVSEVGRECGWWSLSFNLETRPILRELVSPVELQR